MNLFDIANLKNELKNLENKTLEENFWSDSKNSGKILSKIKILKNKITEYNRLELEIENLNELTALVEIEPDEEIGKEILKNTKKIEKEVEKFEINIFLSGKYDNNNAIVTIHPGAGRN